MPVCIILLIPQGIWIKFDLLLVARRGGGSVAFEQVVEEASLPVLNSDQLEEGTNQDLLTKEMGGVVYFNLTEDQEPVSLYGFDDSHKELYPWSTRWIPEEERYFFD